MEETVVIREIAEGCEIREISTMPWIILRRIGSRYAYLRTYASGLAPLQDHRASPITWVPHCNVRGALSHYPSDKENKPCTTPCKRPARVGRKLRWPVIVGQTPVMHKPGLWCIQPTYLHVHRSNDITALFWIEALCELISKRAEFRRVVNCIIDLEFYSRPLSTGFYRDFRCSNETFCYCSIGFRQ
ncbi:hypothetical protein EV356DRAFT_254903 [Viridothelium virens]|uniref:Uncharacterized protein n=1 Tax=Viridothelium virens TaxID=1048519 RepID=A0A6A6H308_VIRVR|nr:hypothetical protein EV356DRAFT_254903 [Viridothelium virens]